MPKKTKYRKSHKRKGQHRNATSMTELNFGSYGIKSLEARWISSRQIESARRVITRYTKRGGKIWIRIFPDTPVTKKGGEIPMGKGKGAVDYYIAVVKPGMILFEMEGVTPDVAKEAMVLAGYKLPVKTKFIKKEE